MTVEWAGGELVEFQVESIETFIGIQRYVSPNGSAPYDGLTWESAYPLPSQVVGDCDPGDLVNIEGGYVYDENAGNGLNWENAHNVRVRSVGEALATIKNTNTSDNGYACRIASNNVTFERVEFDKGEATSTGGRGVVFDGAVRSTLDRCVTLLEANTTHIGVHFVNGAVACGALSPTPIRSVSYGVIGSALGTAVYFENATTCYWDNSGAGEAETLVRFGANSLLCVVGNGCVLQDGETGIQLDPGATNNVVLTAPLRTTVAEIVDLSGNDTNYVDGGLVAHEELYPWSTGQGDSASPVSISNLTTDGAGGTRSDQDYWGDIIPLISPDTITTCWKAIGMHLYAVSANRNMQVETFFAQASLVSDQNGGNDWDENEVALTVDDGSIFQDGDFVWVVGDDRTNGEIMIVDGAPVGNVVTVKRETTADGESGLRYNYDATGVNNRMYVCKRPGLPLYDGFRFGFSADSLQYHARYLFQIPKQLGANVALLVRILDESTNLDTSVQMKAIYSD